MSNSGVELTSNAMFAWQMELFIEWQNVVPVKLMQNGFVDSFNGCLSAERLNEHLIANLNEASRLSETGGSTITPADRTLLGELTPNEITSRSSKNGNQSKIYLYKGAIRWQVKICTEVLALWALIMISYDTSAVGDLILSFVLSHHS